MEIKLILEKGIEKLDDDEKRIFDKLCKEYSRKIERELKGVNFIEVLIKDYSREGKASKFSIHVKVISSTRNFDAGASDWDFARTLHKSFNKVLNEIEHEFHTSNQHDEIRKSQMRRKRD